MKLALILAFALSGSTQDSSVWIDTPCGQHFASECTITDTSFQNFGEVADVAVTCASIESAPQAPGWVPQEGPDGRILRRVSRLYVDGLTFEQCEVPFYLDLSYGSWQGWECLVDPIASKSCS